jgi:iron complex transport system substrate-binding protein
MTRRAALIALALAATVVLAACSSDEPLDSTTTSAAAVDTTTSSLAPTTTTTVVSAEGTFVGIDGVETTIGDVSRIVSLNGDLTEIIFALGLGDNVVGVDVTTTYPPRPQPSTIKAKPSDLPSSWLRRRCSDLNQPS